MMMFFGRALTAALVLAFVAGAGSVQAAVEARVDRSVITLDDTLTLSLRSTEGEDLGEADFTPLNRDFEILNTSRNSSTTYRNGTWKTESELQLILAPKRGGHLQIPPIEVDGTFTRALSVGVNEPSHSLASADTVFLEAEVDQQEVYVQTQLVYTLRLYQSINLNELQLSELSIDNARVEQLENTRFQRRIKDTTYVVTELRFAVFPEESGTLQIPAMTLSASEAGSRRSLFDRGRTLRRRAQPLQVKVLPIPAQFPSRNWLPASEVNISEDWSAAPGSIGIGESITRTITLRASGVASAQIAPIEIEDIPGLKIYPDQPSQEEIKDENGITALSIQSAALLATRAGDFQLPEIRIPWWDTQSRQLRYAVLPATTVSVAAPLITPEAAAAAQTQIPASPPSATQAPVAPNIWMWTTLAAVCGWIISTAVLLHNRRQPTTPGESADNKSQSEGARFKALLQACNDNQALQARSRLLQWGCALLESRGSANIEFLDLRSLGEQLGDSSLEALLYQLDQSLYSKQATQWSGAKLAEELKLWRDQYKSRPTNTDLEQLPPLYGYKPA